MRNRHIAVILLVILLTVMFMACGGKGPTTRTEQGILESWSFDPPSVTIDGIQYGLAEGMDQYLEKAEAGKMYEFVVDIHHNVISVKPL